MSSSQHNARLEAILGETLLAEERGDAVDIDALLRLHPEFAEELREFWANHRAMTRPPAASSESLTPAARNGGLNEATQLFDSHATDESNETLRMDGGSQQPSQHQTPTKIRHFELLEEIGRGGMGVVFRGRDERLGNQVAIKMLMGTAMHDASAVKRFHAEARTAAQLSHPGIVPVFEVGEEHGIHYYAMDLIEGDSLSDLLAQDGPLQPREAAELVRDAALAVSHAHQHGVVHRDIKPSNLIVDQEGKPKLLDFGLAKQSENDLHLTMTGQIIGTLAYMSPEQAAGRNQQVGPAADIYALGALLYCSLTGQPPFRAESQAEMIVKVLTSEPQSPKVPRGESNLARICMRCLEKAPEHRYASAAEVAEDLDSYLRDDPIKAVASLDQRIKRWVRQQPSLAAHVLVLSLVELLRHTKVLWGADQTNDASISWLLGIWAVVCFAMQMLVRRFGSAAMTVWAAADLVFLTWTMSLIESPHGPMLTTYPLAIVCCALLFRVRLVVFTTLGAMAAYGVLLLLRPSDAPAHYHLLFILMLALFGFIVGAHLRRLRLLDEVYSRQRR